MSFLIVGVSPSASAMAAKPGAKALAISRAHTPRPVSATGQADQHGKHRGPSGGCHATEQVKQCRSMRRGGGEVDKLGPGGFARAIPAQRRNCGGDPVIAATFLVPDAAASPAHASAAIGSRHAPAGGWPGRTASLDPLLRDDRGMAPTTLVATGKEMPWPI